MDIELHPKCHTEYDQPITHYEGDEDEVLLSLDNTIEAYAPSPDRSGDDRDISSSPYDMAPDIDVRQKIGHTTKGSGQPRKIRSGYTEGCHITQIWPACDVRNVIYVWR
uniref:(California timema) hypothetical protein n=1 Tax=Timema californicum TaxID=61474 RepID=A0A7R9JES6_TIMCA|nr:unnamed protein product [Timema californicum]